MLYVAHWLTKSVVPEHEGSPCSQDPAAGPYPEPTKLTAHYAFSLLKIHSDSILPSTNRSSQWSLSLGFPTKTFYTFLSSPMHATCPAHLIFLALICLMIFDDESKLRLSIKLLTV
jgi:hypothetical protein